MCPQLFINHKLKSVAHLPWKFLCFKFVNTFIDGVLYSYAFIHIFILYTYIYILTYLYTYMLQVYMLKSSHY